MRTALIIFLSFAFGLNGLTAHADEKPTLPNIVFILADLGYGDVQCLNPEETGKR